MYHPNLVIPFASKSAQFKNKIKLVWYEGIQVISVRAQMAASSEHEFEGPVSGELTGEVFG